MAIAILSSSAVARKRSRMRFIKSSFRDLRSFLEIFLGLPIFAALNHSMTVLTVTSAAMCELFSEPSPSHKQAITRSLSMRTLTLS